MSFPALKKYLARLHSTQADSRVWLDTEGRAQGRYFNTTLTSAFQPIRRLDTDAIVGFEGFARSYSPSDGGLSVWKLLDQAANDDESVELDRLCRMLHAINFFRQPAAEDADLFLSVHARLLAAVDGNHGMAFGRILKMLELPQQKVVLQLPAVAERQGWLLNYVSDNYRRNGFRIAVNVSDTAEAFVLLERVRPDVVKFDARHICADAAIARLLEDCAKLNVRVIFKRVENSEAVKVLRQLGASSGQAIYAQGFLWDAPKASLGPNPPFNRIPQPADFGPQVHLS
jgi:EAL domain-containing protein (putative c-di-GMP-specific phosphodiesterase class I)